MTLRATLRSPWIRFAAGLAAIVALFSPVFRSLADEWSTFPSLSHGFVVPVISAYLVWARRADLARLAPAPSRGGLIVLGSGLLLYAAGTLANEPFASRVAFLISVAGGVLFLGGGPVTRVLGPAVGYLALMIPPPWVTVQGITDRLRLVEATASAWLLPFLGVPVLQEGFLLHLANMTLEVAEVCSSIPAMLSLLALGAAFGYVTRRPLAVHIALIAAAVPLGFISNIARIAMTAAGVHYVGPVVLESLLHTWHGTVVFVMTVGALTLLDTGLMRLRAAPR
jgi:exosortase